MKKILMLYLVCFISLELCFAPPLSATISGQSPERTGKQFLNQIIGADPVRLILVEKDSQRIQVIEYNGKAKVVAEYPCATGTNQGKKESSGDSRTPEGIYFITKVFHDSKITVFGKRAFHLDYPNAFDRFAGRNGDGIYIHGTNRDLKPNSTNGCITMKNQDLDALMSYLKKDVTPVIIVPQRDSLSPLELTIFEKKPDLAKELLLPSEVQQGKVAFNYIYFINDGVQTVAVGEFLLEEGEKLNGYTRSYLGYQADQGWIPLDRIWYTRPTDAGPIGDQVLASSEDDRKPVIAPPEPPKKKVEYPFPVDEKKVADFIERWRFAWQNKKLNDFVGCYSPTFRKDGMDIQGWRTYKDQLNKSYKTIKVDIANVKVDWTPNGAIVMFRQTYKSDKFSADGHKQLYLAYKDGKWAITKELWLKGSNQRD